MSATEAVPVIDATKKEETPAIAPAEEPVVAEAPKEETKVPVS